MVVGVVVTGLVCWHYFQREWRGGERYSLVLVSETTDNVAMVTLDPVNAEAMVFLLPGEVLIESVRGYGEYRVGALLRLGEIEGVGSDLIEKSIQELFGLYISGVVRLEHDLDFDDLSVNQKWVGDYSRQIIKAGMLGDLPVFDAIRYYQEIKAVRLDKFTIVSLESSRLLTEERLGDGTMAFRVDTIRLDQFLKNNLEHVLLQSEEIGVAVVNTTGEPGLGTRAAHLLSGNGIDVVAVDDNTDQIDATRVIVSDKKLLNSPIIRIVRSLFFDPSFEVGDTGRYRADMVVFLGDDYRQFIDGDSL